MTPLVMTAMRRSPFKTLSLMDFQRHSLMDLKTKILNLIHLQRSRRMYFKSRRMYFKYKTLNLTHLRRPRRMDPRPRETRPYVPMDPRRDKR